MKHQKVSSLGRIKTESKTRIWTLFGMNCYGQRIHIFVDINDFLYLILWSLNCADTPN